MMRCVAAMMRARQATTHKVPEGARLFQRGMSPFGPVAPQGLPIRRYLGV